MQLGYLSNTFGTIKYLAENKRFMGIAWAEAGDENRKPELVGVSLCYRRESWLPKGVAI
jgi:hypothetical protein